MTEQLKHALIIFAKLPVPGTVKTRMIPPLSQEEAAELYRHMLEDILEKVKALTGLDRYLFYADEPGAASYFQRVSGGSAAFPQKGRDLGERMEEAFARLFEMGYTSVAIIGSDSPDLPLSYISMAFARLQTAEVDVLFGPSDDGGYYLLAMKRLQSPLFRDIPWSAATVLGKSMEIAAEAGMSSALLPLWHDVDTADALFRPEMLDARNGAPRTRAFITAWLEKKQLPKLSGKP